MSPRLTEAASHGISQGAIMGNGTWRTTHGFFNASAKKRHVLLLVSFIFRASLITKANHIEGGGVAIVLGTRNRIWISVTVVIFTSCSILVGT